MVHLNEATTKTGVLQKKSLNFICNITLDALQGCHDCSPAENIETEIVKFIKEIYVIRNILSKKKQK